MNRLIDTGQSLDGAEKAADITQESEQCAEGDAPLQDEHAAERQSRDPGKGDDQIGRRTEAGVNADGLDNHLICGIHIPQETLLLSVFHGAAANRDYAGQNFVKAGVDL